MIADTLCLEKNHSMQIASGAPERGAGVVRCNDLFARASTKAILQILRGSSLKKAQIAFKRMAGESFPWRWNCRASVCRSFLAQRRLPFTMQLKL